MAKPLFALVIAALLAVAVLTVARAESEPAAQPAAATPAPAATAPAAVAPAAAAAAPVAPAAEAPKPAMQTKMEKVSYSLGLDIGRSLRQQGVEVNLDLLIRGLREGLANAKPLLAEEEMTNVLFAFQQEMVAKRAREQADTGMQNKMRADGFLAENKKREGVVTLPSGLQYQVLQAGTGPKPTAADTVNVNYRGTLMDGTEFDSSAKHGGPAKFRVGNVIAGWQEALQLMPVGSKWRLFIPPSLAYGEEGMPPVIPPNSLLSFEVELLGIEKPAAAR